MGGIYLDHNATTPVDPEVLAAMLPWLREGFGNPGSAHLWGARAHQALEGARRAVAGLVGSRPAEILFTSGGTEANNLGLRGAALARRPREGHVVATAVEHPATLRVLEGLAEEAGYRYTLVPVDRMGMVDPAAMAAACREETVLATLMHANNEVGALQPVREVAARLRPRGVLIHADAAQSAGKVPIDVNDLGVDLLSLAGHKLYAPKGIGALYVRKGTPLRPLLRGAGQERGLRPGTEPVFLAVGLGRACELAAAALAAGGGARLAALRDRLEALLLAALPGLVVHAGGAPRLPNTSSVGLAGLRGPDLVVELGEELACSAGAACHHDRDEPSHVLQAMGVPREVALGTIRLSLGRHTTPEEVATAATLLAAAAARLRQCGGAV